MHIEFANIPTSEPKQLNLPDAPFLSYKPEFPKLKHAWKEFGAFPNVLIVGHGGSITTFEGLYQALGTDKNVKILSTVDPDYIAQIKKIFTKDRTLVIAISKSGENVTQLEAVLQFSEYQSIFVTERGTPLEQIAKAAKARVYMHPPIGGRYTGFTEVALLPAAICGLDIERVYAAGRAMLELYRQDNLAMRAAQAMFAAEQQGAVDVFMPFYSHYLFPFQNLVMQLCHESFGKNGTGQSYVALEGPEWQHHTMQRFFGGRKNVAGFFVTVDHFTHDVATVVPHGMQSIAIKNGSFYDLHKLRLSYAMHAEFQASLEDAKIQSIPVAALTLDSVSAEEVGAFIAFWQLYAVYSSVLRGVDPFNQPAVENSKKISWKKRQDFKRS